MDIEEFMLEWSHRRSVDGKSFNELLALDGIPLWWFYNRFFIWHVMPRQINTFESIRSGKELSILQKIKLQIYPKISKKYILIKEKRKIKFLRRELKPNHKPKVLFLTYTNHISGDKLYRIQGIIDKIREKGNIKDIVIFADPLSSGKYAALKDRCNIYQYHTDEIAKKAEEESDRLATQWKQISREQKRKMLWNEMDLWDYLQYAFNFFFSREFLYITALYYYIFKEILAKENVRVVLITSQNSIFEKCLIAAANKLKINVLRLQHGIGEEIVGPDQYDIENKYFYKLVFSDYHKKEAMAVGWPKEKVIVVGSVVFDHIAKYIASKKKQGKDILLATIPVVQSNLMDEKEYLRRIMTILKEIKKVNDKVTIKLHPRETPKERCVSNYIKLLDELGLMNSAVFGGDVLEEKFYELVEKSDIMVNFGSTVAIEAMIIGRPTVTIDLLGNKFHTQWIEQQGITVNVNWDGDISGAIRKALLNDRGIRKRSEEYIKRKCGKINGKAYEKVAKVIELMSK